jgi:4-diphosphocytidyl-2-C-methyl-D-erythritol kinase
MMHIERKAFAKINLSLNILPETGERDYYRVRFINTSISLHDRVRIEKTENEGITINEPAIDERENIARHAALLMFETYRLPGGLKITIEKNIPTRAGLGGGSSDAAAVLNGINDLYALALSTEERVGLASKLGMDVCFCVKGGLCLIEGIGDVVKTLPFTLPPLELLIATPKEKKPSTSWAYSILEWDELGKSHDLLEALVESIRNGDIPMLSKQLHNDFEEAIFRYYPVSHALKRRMKELGALSAILAGSGLSVFAVFEKRHALIRAKAQLEREGFTCHAANPVEA